MTPWLRTLQTKRPRSGVNQSCLKRLVRHTEVAVYINQYLPPLLYLITGHEFKCWETTKCFAHFLMPVVIRWSSSLCASQKGAQRFHKSILELPPLVTMDNQWHPNLKIIFSTKISATVLAHLFFIGKASVHLLK